MAEDNTALLTFSVPLTESALKEFQDSCDVQADGGKEKFEHLLSY